MANKALINRLVFKKQLHNIRVIYNAVSNKPEINTFLINDLLITQLLINRGLINDYLINK